MRVHHHKWVTVTVPKSVLTKLDPGNDGRKQKLVHLPCLRLRRGQEQHTRSFRLHWQIFQTGRHPLLVSMSARSHISTAADKQSYSGNVRPSFLISRTAEPTLVQAGLKQLFDWTQPSIATGVASAGGFVTMISAGGVVTCSATPSQITSDWIRTQKLLLSCTNVAL